MDNRKLSYPSVKFNPSHYTVPSYNRKLGRTTRNFILVVHGTTLYYSLIRTLEMAYSVKGLSVLEKDMNDALTLTIHDINTKDTIHRYYGLYMRVSTERAV